MSNKYTVEQITAKIQKLLNLASDPNANEHIAEQAAAKAQELMQQWAIDEAALGHADPENDPFTTEIVLYLKNKQLRWEANLAQAVAPAMMVHMFTRDYTSSYVFAGRTRDVKMAVFIFNQLRNVIEGLSRRRLSEHGAEIKMKYNRSIYNAQQCRAFSGCHPTVYRQRWLDSWLLGAVTGITTQLEAQKRATAPAQSQALMVVETRQEEAESWAREEFKLTSGKARKSMKIFTDATNRGIQDGKAVQIHKGLTIKETKELHD